MSGLTVDASVWTAAADPSDSFSGESRAFFAEAVERGARLFVPTFAVVEVACALARRLRDAARARRLTGVLLSPSHVTHVPVDDRLLASSLLLGTDSLLRGADALYAATAEMTRSQLVSWDDEHVARAAAVTPRNWLAAPH